MKKSITPRLPWMAWKESEAVNIVDIQVKGKASARALPDAEIRAHRESTRTAGASAWNLGVLDAGPKRLGDVGRWRKCVTRGALCTAGR